MIPYNPFNWFWFVEDKNQTYSSASASYVDSSDPEQTTRIDTEANMIAVLRAANVPPYHSVSSYRIVRRLEAAGLSQSALAVLDAPENAVLKARFYTLGMIPADDVDAIALVTAAGGDPAVILAPDTGV